MEQAFNTLPIPDFDTVPVMYQGASDDFLGRLTALLFVSPTCTACTTTLHELRALHYKAMGNTIVICRANRYDSQRLAQARERGVRIRVLTNSLASTDVPAVHAG